MPWILGLIPNHTKCKHCRRSLKDRGTLPLFDAEPQIWIFAMLNGQNCEKWGKTGISKRVIKALFVNMYGKFQFSISQNNVNLVVGGLKHKSAIFTIYAWLSVWLHCAFQISFSKRKVEIFLNSKCVTTFNNRTA